jgi:transcription elongation factor Elf1
MKCPYCGAEEIVKYGLRTLAKGKKQRYGCRGCGKHFSFEEAYANPKLLYFDIETSPIRADVWKAGKTYVNPDFIIQDWFVLAWAAKWVCDDQMHSRVLLPREIKRANDRRIVGHLWNLFDAADVIIGHNSRNFDIKRMNWRFLIHGLRPPSPYKTVDTLQVAKYVFGATSNKLDFLTKQLGLNGKMQHTPDLWQRCMNGDSEALRTMREYNEIDVLEGESLYLKMRPFMRNHPNMGLYYETEELRCRNCGMTTVDKIGKYHTPAQTYIAWRCKCGAVGRTEERLPGKELLK